MKQEIEMVRDADCTNGLFPVGGLGKGDRFIQLNFNHSASFEQAKFDWERRKKRIKFDNLFVKMTIPNDEAAERFSVLPFNKKVGFCSTENERQDIEQLVEWNYNNTSMRHDYGFDFCAYVRASIKSGGSIHYNLFKMLSGEKGFMRKQ